MVVMSSWCLWYCARVVVGKFSICSELSHSSFSLWNFVIFSFHAYISYPLRGVNPYLVPTALLYMEQNRTTSFSSITQIFAIILQVTNTYPWRANTIVATDRFTRLHAQINKQLKTLLFIEAQTVSYQVDSYPTATLILKLRLLLTNSLR